MLHRQPLRRQVVLASILILLGLLAAILWAGTQTRLERRAELSAQSASLAKHDAVRALDAAGSQRHVVRQERQAAVGQLVPGVAHEKNNPLKAILGTTPLRSHDAAIADHRVRPQRPRRRDVLLRATCHCDGPA